jgi:hypothetical protein
MFISIQQMSDAVFVLSNVTLQKKINQHMVKLQ